MAWLEGSEVGEATPLGGEVAANQTSKVSDSLDVPGCSLSFGEEPCESRRETDHAKIP